MGSIINRNSNAASLNPNIPTIFVSSIQFFPASSSSLATGYEGMFEFDGNEPCHSRTTSGHELEVGAWNALNNPTSLQVHRSSRCESCQYGLVSDYHEFLSVREAPVSFLYGNGPVRLCSIIVTCKCRSPLVERATDETGLRFIFPSHILSPRMCIYHAPSNINKQGGARGTKGQAIEGFNWCSSFPSTVSFLLHLHPYY